MPTVPTLETTRMVLRLQTMDDWPEYAALMMSDRAVFMGGPFPRDVAWGMFCHDIAQWTLMGHGALMLENRETGICLGQVGVNSGPHFPEHELGWLVYPHAEGQGYAYEGALALKHWAFQVIGFRTLVSYIDPPNLRSRALAERLGAKIDNDAARQGPDRCGLPALNRR